MTYFIMRQTSSREDGDLLTTGDRVHGINSGNTSLDHFFRIDSGEGVDG
jgi:hypothetical protein